MLEAADLRCERGGKILFEHLSFRLRDGELLRVSGANGSVRSCRGPKACAVTDSIFIVPPTPAGR